MLKVSKERILAKLNNYSREALKRASEMAIEQNQFEVTVSHLLWALLNDPEGTVTLLLEKFDKALLTKLKDKIQDDVEFLLTYYEYLQEIEPVDFLNLKNVINDYMMNLFK